MKPAFAIAAAGIAIAAAFAPMPVMRAISTVAAFGAARMQYKAYTSVATISSVLENRRFQRSSTELKGAGKPSAP